MLPALVLGSHTVGLGIARALGAKGVPVVAVYHDPNDHGHVSRHVSEACLSPHPESAESEFVQYLIGMAGRFPGSFLLPASDATMLVVSRHKNLLDRYYVVACPDRRMTELLVDKKQTYARAEELGVPVPLTVIPESRADVEEYCSKVTYPCLVKPSQGHRYFEVFGRKMVKAENREQAISAYEQAREADLEVMLQEYIPGPPSQGVNYNSYNWGEGNRVEFTAAKVRNAPRDTGSPCAASSAHIPEILEYGRQLLGSIGFQGYACTEFKRDPRDGVFKLMEVNARHNLSTALAVTCGVNFPWLHYDHLMNGNTPEPHTYESGIYWTDLIRDLSCAPGHLLRERRSLGEFLIPYRGRHVDAILDKTDPAPFRKRCVGLAKAGLKRFV